MIEPGCNEGLDEFQQQRRGVMGNILQVEEGSSCDMIGRRCCQR